MYANLGNETLTRKQNYETWRFFTGQTHNFGTYNANDALGVSLKG